MKLTREQALKLIVDGDENWDYNAELLYDSTTDRYPSIYDALAVLKVDRSEVDNIRVRKMKDLIN